MGCELIKVLRSDGENKEQSDCWTLVDSNLAAGGPLQETGLQHVQHSGKEAAPELRSLR